MPPHCPIRHCARCGQLRPYVAVDGQPHCTDCNPWADAEGNIAATDDQLARAVDGLDGESAFSMWAQRYLEGIDDQDDEPWIVLRFGYRPEDMTELSEVLAEGHSALRRTIGAETADQSRLARWAKAVGKLQDGTPFHQMGAIGQ